MAYSRLGGIASLALPVSLLLVASAAFATPRPLRDTTLGAITAGNANVVAATPNGGAIVAGNSTANISTSGSVMAQDSQASAKAVNLVNATDSAVANGVNVWDGNASGTNTGLTVNQSNMVMQTGISAAELASYVRAKPDISTSMTTKSAMTNKGSVTTAQTVLGQELQGGEGFSVAGSLNGTLTGGDISATNTVSTTAQAGANTSLAGGLFTIGGSGNLTFYTKQTLKWTLPDLSVQASIVGCEVELGSCKANGSYDTSTQKTLTYQGPIAVKNAHAKYIVVDGSTLTAKENYQVELTDGTESNAAAVNLVNASGSSVTNGVNVAYTTGTSPGLTLNQTNTVVQYR